MESVYMSVETIAVVISAAALLASLATGFGWMIRRTDKLSDRVTREIGGARDSFRKEIGEVETRIRKDLSDRMTGVERELVEVKIAIARIEGPPRQLVAAR